MFNPKTTNKIAFFMIRLLTLLVVLILVLMLGYILTQGVPHLSWQFLTDTDVFSMTATGIGLQLFNSLYLLVLTLIISVPLALGAGIYLAEYAPNNWLTATIRTAIEMLSSLPSVVVGLFGFLILVIQLNLGFSIIAGALALTLFNLPLMTRSVESALVSVPTLQKEAGLGLGLSKWKTICKIILPAALPGILTGVILAAGRVFGEAAALIYTAGQASTMVDFTNWNPLAVTSPLNIFRPAETLAVHIWKINAEGMGGDVNAVSAGSAAVLVIVLLVFNISARFLGDALYRKLTAKRN